ncbi:MAG: GGDEF domain-containing protein [Anaeroplasmataceae bacterium]|nr:GGDEF domain-containing protein [Anaeroplasmataceae bacterium]
MDSMKLLSEFSDFYLKANTEDSLFYALYPNPLDIAFPVPFEDLLSQLLPKMDSSEKDRVVAYFRNKNRHKGFNFKANDHWYSIEYKEFENEHLFHMYCSDHSIKTLESELTLTQLDPLSGLLHKTAIEKYISHELENPSVTNALVFIIDIDYFKNINDNFGHVFGDQVIIEVSRSLKSISKRAKTGRIGGDEFLIFLEDDLDRDGVKNIARLIRYLLDKIVVNGESFPITATVGIAEYPTDGKTFEELYKCCDKALYRGKQKGRDCHIIYDPNLHGNINASLPKNNSSNVKVLSITGFIKNITDTLIQMPKTKKEYDAIFKKICDYFNLERVVVVDEEGVTVGHEVMNFGRSLEMYKKINLETYVINFIYDNMYMMNDTLTLRSKDEELYKIYLDSGVKSFVQVLLYDEEEKPTGFISYEVLNERRVWQTSEISYLVIISNLIKAFYLKARQKK